MTEKDNTYRNIGCSYYDQLEAYAVKRTHCVILYTEDDLERSVDGVIIDVFSKDAAEYLKLENGTVIRLDHLISVNGIPLNYVC